MQMTEAEIVRSYKQADKKREQINILSELNLCDKKTIREILRKNGVDVAEPGPKEPAPKKTTQKAERDPDQEVPVPEVVMEFARAHLDVLQSRIKGLDLEKARVEKQHKQLSGWIRLMEKGTENRRIEGR